MSRWGLHTSIHRFLENGYVNAKCDCLGGATKEYRTLQGEQPRFRYVGEGLGNLITFHAADMAVA